MMDEKELLAILKEEESDASSFYTSELSEDQAEALERYYAEPYGDELPDRSQVVTQDIAEAINWMMPDLIRAFLSSDQMVSVAPESDEDEGTVEDAGKAMEHVFFKDNPGEAVLHDFLFDGLVSRVGWVSVQWEDPEPEPADELEGVPAEQLARYVDDPEYEILEQEERVEETDLGDVPVFDLKVQRTKQHGRCVVGSVPPEEIAFSRRSKDAASADYIRRKEEKYLRDIMRQYPDKKAELERTGGGYSENDTDDDARKQERFVDETEQNSSKSAARRNRRKVWLINEFIHIDYDEDDIVELRHVRRVGDVILENNRVKCGEYFCWSPIRVSHKMVGRSVADQTADIQKIRTVVARRGLDSLDQALTPQKIVNSSIVDEDDIDAIIENEIGAVIVSNGDANAAVRELVTPDVSQSAFSWMEFWQQEGDARTGSSRSTQGVSPELLQQNMSGVAVNLLQQPGFARKELIARWAAIALKTVFEAILSKLCSYQDHARQVKIRGKFVTFDPRRWKDDWAVTVHTGPNMGNRDVQISHLNLIATKQEQILLNAPENPVVGMEEYRNTLAEMVEVMGYRNPGKFFGEIPEVPEGVEQPEQPDPAVIEAQGKAQAELAKVQGELELKRDEAMADSAIDADKMRREQDRKDAELAADLDRKRDQAAAELALKREVLEAELALKAQVARTNGSGSTDIGDVQVGGEPG